jgi:hypothetical protein
MEGEFVYDRINGYSAGNFLENGTLTVYDGYYDKGYFYVQDSSVVTLTVKDGWLPNHMNHIVDDSDEALDENLYRSPYTNTNWFW